MSCTYSSPPFYAIVSCPNCGFISVSKFHAKAHRCPKCNTNYTLRPKRQQSRIIAVAWTQDQAIEIRRRLTGNTSTKSFYNLK
jgi:ssDNA-binding Zn-finger/Zn-ribbon topoisomerase 1